VIGNRPPETWVNDSSTTTLLGRVMVFSSTPVNCLLKISNRLMMVIALGPRTKRLSSLVKRGCPIRSLMTGPIQDRNARSIYVAPQRAACKGQSDIGKGRRRQLTGGIPDFLEFKRVNSEHPVGYKIHRAAASVADYKTSSLYIVWSEKQNC